MQFKSFSILHLFCSFCRCGSKGWRNKNMQQRAVSLPPDLDSRVSFQINMKTSMNTTPDDDQEPYLQFKVSLSVSYKLFFCSCWTFCCFFVQFWGRPSDVMAAFQKHNHQQRASRLHCWTPNSPSTLQGHLSKTQVLHPFLSHHSCVSTSSLKLKTDWPSSEPKNNSPFSTLLQFF